MAGVEELWRLAQGYRVTQAIHVAAVLRLSDHLADGPHDVSRIAEQAGCDPASLYRLMRALATVGVYEELPDRHFGLTPLGNALRTDVAGSVAPWVEHMASGSHHAAWGGLLGSIRTGENAFKAIHGESAWDYRAARPEDNAVFDAAMTSISQIVSTGVLDAYDFGGLAKIIDVGGGRGALLGAILARYPDARGVLGDQPHVIVGALGVLGALGVQDRCEVVAVDFFDSVPAGGDAYVLKSILHDWEDAESVAILRSVRRAMAPGAVVLLVERLIGDPNGDPEGMGMLAAFSDLNMLVGPGGRERTEAEFETVLGAAGLRRSRTVRTPTGFAVIEAVADSEGGAPTT
jgi:O-methyltransferase domain/Dimerisation domain